MRLVIVLLALAWVLVACAELVPGVSRESDVVASFGAPAETQQLAEAVFWNIRENPTATRIGGSR